jgi:hypothetical protein
VSILPRIAALERNRGGIRSARGREGARHLPQWILNARGVADVKDGPEKLAGLAELKPSCRGCTDTRSSADACQHGAVPH